MRALARCCLGPWCKYDGTVYEGQATLVSGDGSLRAHSPCIDGPLAEIERLREVNAGDPEALDMLRRVEDGLARFDWSGSGTLQVGWDVLAARLGLLSALGGPTALN